MPKTAKELTPAEVSKKIREKLAEKPGAGFRVAVGGVTGLLLQVPPDKPLKDEIVRSSRVWLLRYSIGGRRRDQGLGGYPEVSLAEARDRARKIRAAIFEGRDPLAERRAARTAIATAAAKAVTFKTCAEGYIKTHEKEWKNAKHAAQWTATLETYAYPVLGNMGVADIDTSHILRVLEPIWSSKTETATRVRGRIETVLDAAAAKGYRTGPNSARWKGHLDHMLAQPMKIAKVEHHAAVDVDAMHAFWLRLQAAEGQGARALQFTILTAARSGMTRMARSGHIDLEAAVWTVPATLMKGKKGSEREHRVPLPTAAVQLLRDQGPGEPDALIFPGTNGKPLSDMSLTAVLKRMKVKATAHGFRSTFRDWAGDRTNYARDLIEQAMAHTLESKVEAAYRRSNALDKRRHLMEAWATFLVTPPATATVTPSGAKRA